MNSNSINKVSTSNKLKQVILLFILLLPFSILAQDCDCASTFQWLQTTFEENDAGFEYILEKKGEQAYQLHNQIYFDKVAAIHTPIVCQNTLREWLSFFRKAHIEFYYTGEVEATDDVEDEAITKEEIQSKPTINKKNPNYILHEKFLNAEEPFLEILNENTLYLRIPSFRNNQKPLIDKLILANRSKILNTENLIIDIRNGVGGSDTSYEELMPFIYTNPIRIPTVEYRSTPINNQRMYEMATNTGFALQIELNPTEEEMKEYRVYYDTLSNHLGEYVNIKPVDVDILQLDSIFPFPKNVGILINENNVSTDEQFILEARQSKKVKLFGTTTMGGLDISNLNLAFSPAKDFLLVYGITKSLRIPDMVVDDIGIMPDYFIDKEILEVDWINYVNEILNQ